MTLRIRTINQHPFLFPVVTRYRPHIGGAVAHRQPTAAAVRLIIVGTVQQQVGVNGDLAGLEFDIDYAAVAFDIINCLIEDIIFVCFAGAELQLTLAMRTGDEAHAAIGDIGIIYGQPYGGGL